MSKENFLRLFEAVVEAEPGTLSGDAESINRCKTPTILGASKNSCPVWEGGSPPVIPGLTLKA